MGAAQGGVEEGERGAGQEGAGCGAGLRRRHILLVVIMQCGTVHHSAQWRHRKRAVTSFSPNTFEICK